MNRYKILDLIRRTEIVSKCDSFLALANNHDVNIIATQLQRDNLSSFLIRLKSNVFYSSFLENFSESFIQHNPYFVLQQLPFSDKRSLSQNYSVIRNKKFPGEDDYTGGSTGSPFHYVVGKKELSSLIGFSMFLWRYLAGYNWNDDTIVIGGTSIGDRNNIKKRILHFLQRRKYISGGEINEENAIEFARLINKAKRPIFLYGYPSSILQYTQLFDSLKLSINKKKIKSVLSTSETLTDERKQRIEQYFQTKVINLYGARDGGISAGSIDNKHFIFNGTNCVAENIEFDGVNELVLTNLDSDAFPFVRYRIGDIADVFTSDHGFPFILTNLQGRTRDFIHLSPTKKIHGSIINKVFKDTSIIEYQIVQHKDFSCDVRIQPIKQLNASEEQNISKRLKGILGEIPFRVSIEESLIRQGNNKLRNIISEIER